MILHVEWMKTALRSAQTAAVQTSIFASGESVWQLAADAVQGVRNVLWSAVALCWWHLPGYKNRVRIHLHLDGKVIYPQYLRLWNALEFVVDGASWQMNSNALAAAHRPVLLEEWSLGPLLPKHEILVLRHLSKVEF